MRYKNRLPPLDALVSFEAAARLQNFTAASRELCISQSAVSQNIRHLEQSLGVQLFTRSHRTVTLNHLGKEYQHTVATTLDHLANATNELRTTRGRKRLTLATDQSIVWMWLMPRLPIFQKDHPEIAIRLVASDDESDCLGDTIDISIIHGDGNWPGYHSQELFPEEIFPVCSPDYLAQSSPINAIDNLSEHTLIHLEDEHWQWMTWRMWLTEIGVQVPSEQHGLIVNNYPLLMESVKNGQGIALGWRYLVDNELDKGTLIRPLEESINTSNGYHVVWPAFTEKRSEDAKILCDWLVNSYDASRINL